MQVLVHEATLESAQERVAVARGHSTPTMAATFAKYINVRRKRGGAGRSSNGGSVCDSRGD